MNLAIPVALAWAALAVPIVVFYILKIRLRRVPVSTTIFWRQIFDEKQPRSIWQNLRHLISLLCQLALLLLLVLALTEPYFSWEVLSARRLVLVVDNSASMNATDVAPSRFARAKGQAQTLIAGLRFRDEMSIVVAGSEPQVAVGMTGHQRTLRTALESIEPSDGPTRVAEAVALGRRLLGEHPHGRVVVLSDGCFEGAEALADSKDVEWHTIGTKADNVGITRFQVRRSLLDPLGYEILAEVTNAGEVEVECRLEVELNESPVDVLPLKLKPGQTWSQSLEKTSTDGGRLMSRLNRDDALSADNTAWALLPQREPQNVLLITEGNLFLQKAFEANPLVKLSTAKALPDKIPTDTILVFHRKVPVTIPPGNVFVVDPEGSTDLWQVGAKLENPIVTKQDKDSPLMAHVRLDNVLLPEARQLTFSNPPQVLAGALSGEPLFAAVERPSGKVVVLTVNLDQGDLTFRTAFPILVTNALGWFAGNSGELRESLITGAIAEVQLPADSQSSERASVSLWTPAGRPRPLPGSVDRTTIGPLDQSGVWTIAPADTAQSTLPGAPVQELACNIASRAETDLRPSDSLLARVVEAPLAAGLFTRPIWFYLVLLAWLLAAVEWFLYQRRVIT